MQKIIICTLVIFVFLCGDVLCYDDEITHPDLTEKAIKTSFLDAFLTNSLAFKHGIETKIPTNSKARIGDLLTTGSKLEDTPNCRAASHFLNPRKAWDQAGLTDTNETILGAFVINPACVIQAPFSSRFSIHKYSVVTWATGHTSPATQGGDTGNEMDWNAARNYYRLALTATSNDAREAYFAQAFRALGHVMHLVQNMAVPAHVRDDTVQKLREELS